MEDHRRPTDVSLVFPPHPVWVRTARETVRTLLAASHRPELTDIAVLLTSEAVTNAVNACTGRGCSAPVTLRAGWAGPRRLRVLVHDEAPGLPDCRTPGPDEEEAGGSSSSPGGPMPGACAGTGRGGARRPGSSWGGRTRAGDRGLGVGARVVELLDTTGHEHLAVHGQTGL